MSKVEPFDSATTSSRRAQITLDGGDGSIIKGAVETIQPETRPELLELMTWVTMSDDSTSTPTQTRPVNTESRGFGASGVGLCRTEHMFFDAGRIVAVREMILAQTEGATRSGLPSSSPCSVTTLRPSFELWTGSL